MTVATPLGRVCEQAGLDPSVVPGEAVGTPITGVTCDSRLAAPGVIFVAVPGANVDGATFAAEAVSRGAVAVVAAVPRPEGLEAPWIRVDDARVALARLAAAAYGDPSHELLVVGTTGTNGKTTTAYLIEAALEEAGIPCGRVGSVSYRVGEVERAAPRTTPEASDLQAMMRAMVDEGCQGCVLEASSHGLVLHRTDAVRFAAAVFTNLTRDHLDFHGDMASYFAAKQRLFDMLEEGVPSVINVDDAYGRRLQERVGRPVTYAMDSRADVRPDRASVTVSGIELEVLTPRGRLHLRSPLLGRGNAYNVLAAADDVVAHRVRIGPVHGLGHPVDGLPVRRLYVDLVVTFPPSHRATPATGLQPTPSLGSVSQWLRWRRRRSFGAGLASPGPVVATVIDHGSRHSTRCGAHA